MADVHLPSFFGYSQENVRDFIDEINSYYEAKNVTNNRRKLLLMAQLRGLVRHVADLAQANGGAIYTTIAAATALLAGGAALPHNEIVEIHFNWLRETYAGAEVQRQVKDQLTQIRQKSTESPRDF